MSPAQVARYRDIVYIKKIYRWTLLQAHLDLDHHPRALTHKDPNRDHHPEW
jgi:hypothetical protein